jgi:Uma2 family endonuclease
MSERARKYATYEDLYTIPENMTGEIIYGQLVVTPRPSRKHIYAASALGGELAPPYQFGRGGGPGGWVILIEPEIGFGEHILVPDLAAWRVERYPEEEPRNWISVSPDWVCEIISPSTEIRDRDEKMSVYAEHGVPYVWLINPIIMTLEAYKLLCEGWVRFAMFNGHKMARVEPFHEIEIDLGSLWGPQKS